MTDQLTTPTQTGPGDGHPEQGGPQGDGAPAAEPQQDAAYWRQQAERYKQNIQGWQTKAQQAESQAQQYQQQLGQYQQQLQDLLPGRKPQQEEVEEILTEEQMDRYNQATLMGDNAGAMQILSGAIQRGATAAAKQARKQLLDELGQAAQYQQQASGAMSWMQDAETARILNNAENPVTKQTAQLYQQRVNDPRWSGYQGQVQMAQGTVRGALLEQCYREAKSSLWDTPEVQQFISVEGAGSAGGKTKSSDEVPKSFLEASASSKISEAEARENWKNYMSEAERDQWR